MQATKLLVELCGFIIINAFVICTFVTGSHGKPAQSTKQNEFGTLDIRNGQIITGYIGCLFSKRLCDQETEWCYNDGVFGRCLSGTGVLDNESLYRYDLSKGDAHAVEREMEKLFALGYRWGHLYTQCVLQTLLESIRRGFTWDQSVCGDVQDQDLKGALRAFEDDIDPKNLAFIKFHPNDPHTEYADESYKPPKALTHLQETPLVEGKEKMYDTNEMAKSKASEKLKQQTIDISAGKFAQPLEGNGDQKLMEEELANAVEKAKNKNGNNKNGKNKQKNKNKPKGDRKPIVKKSVLNMEYPFDLTSLSSTSQDKNSQLGGNTQQSASGVGPGGSNAATGLLREWNSLPIDDDVELNAVLQPKIFSSFYNTPDLFRIGVEAKDQSPPNSILPSNDFVVDDGILRNDDIQEALQAELARREEQEQIRQAAAQLEAAIMADALLRSQLESSAPANTPARKGLDANDLSYRDRDDENLEFLLPNQYRLPSMAAKDSVPQLTSFQALPPSIVDRNSLYNSPYITSNRNYDDLQNDDPDQDDRSLMYTEGGLVFLNKGENRNVLNDFVNGDGQETSDKLELIGQPDDLGFYDVPLTKEDQESFMYLKRGQPIRDELELIRREREHPETGMEDADVLLLDNPGNPVDLGENRYEELSSYLLGENYGGGNMGFERQERLDVKKPGPWYRTVNNYAFDKEDKVSKFLSEMQPAISEVTYAEGPEEMVQYDSNDNDLRQALSPKHAQVDKSNGPAISQLESFAMHKKALPVIFDKEWTQKAKNKNIEIVDTSYINLELDTSANWNGAQQLVDELAEVLNVDRTLFQHVPVQQNNVVSFKVLKNSEGLNASAIAQEIEKVKDKVEKQFGIKIVKIDVGRGADSNIPSVMYLEQDPTSNKMFIATFAVCGLVAAVLVAAVALFLVRKHAKSKEKIVRLSQEDPSYEACKDYQDLCRTRMAASKNNEKMEPLRGPTHKIASKDSENGSSSSRSSTSSWSEEPVLTNMDISTGHMVLSYMEDHLKNRDRMDREWAALSAYEADPCSTAVAEKPETAKKNRYSNSLPFDHSRVILNDLANVSGTDYINASTITDHDPRNPAYIATQGPLPNTVADFWQMVWEQGSVVIVNLTRLTENAQALCHRYWPEEGSELHHIYEVHLVSEHIWCDEYLVRSFYLKNLKTGETRTVTQFHFLAWPENGIPQSTKALLEFRRKVNKSYRGRSCPIIVHCSDGSGRTGTYCLIDMVLNRMSKGAKEIDIAATLEHIRDQRPNMVRSKQQFEFVLMAVAEEVHAILKALPQ